MARGLQIAPARDGNPQAERWSMDTILVVGILLLILALLGGLGLVGTLQGVAWVLLLVAVIMISWRVIAGRRPV